MENTVKIGGKELFIEALIDFMNDKSIEDQIKTLESLKGDTRDWQVIDNKINELFNSIDENKKFNENKKQISKIKTLLDTYGDDGRFQQILENLVQKSNNSNDALLMSETANKMKSNFKYLNYSKKQLTMISEKYNQKAKELSFKENGFSS
jgi:mRNA deadenylase 3'-5' endonuclease subunit Ccr4